ncbi:probable cytochrome P450 49a1 [Ylistrum balloti]|uniref:probable cytochrome P450 49a1 n=1 Tax=Ylistrum balloti TaxID=509963 RepID=UPI002905D44E|nr:probable cytochrome P450 49a1 [Ylistrum balloti]
MLKRLLRRRMVNTCVVGNWQRSNMTSADPTDANIARSFQDIPGPSGIYQWPFIGLRLQLKPFTEFKITRLDQLMMDYKRRYGPICKARMGKRWMVFLFEPSVIEKAFRTEGRYPQRPSIMILEHFYKGQACPSISILQGKEWFEMRRPPQMTLKKPKNLSKFIPQLSEVADDFVEKFRNNHIMEDLPLPCLDFTTEGAGTLCFGLRLGCLNKTSGNDATTILKHVRGVFGAIGESMYSLPWFLLYETSSYRQFVEHIAFLRRMADGHLQRAKHELNNRTTGDEKANLMLDMINTPGMTSEMISNNLVDLFIAGLDSTAMAITFLFYQLARNPDKQEKLFEEIRDHIPPSGPISEDALLHLPYLKACLKESFRLVFPVSIGSSRVLQKDIQLLGYHIPKGCVIAGGNSVIGRDKEYFNDPEMFLPERWLRSGPTHIHAFAQLPFGFGPRDCIGKRFAEIEVYICVSKIVRNYKIILPKDVTEVPYIYQMFAIPEKPFSLHLLPRSTG